VIAYDKKLTIHGKNVKYDEQGQAVERPVTRIYFTVPTEHSPEAFKSLFDQFVDAGIMKDFMMALNLESYQGNLNQRFENNTIIAYVNGNKPELMGNIAKSIQKAKQRNPELWKLNPDELAKAKTDVVKDLMMPLDDTTAFVECHNIYSYHQGPGGRMYSEMTGGNQKISLDDLTKSFQMWSPDKPGLFTDDRNRRRYMPPLLFDNVPRPSGATASI